MGFAALALLAAAPALAETTHPLQKSSTVNLMEACRMKAIQW